MTTLGKATNMILAGKEACEPWKLLNFEADFVGVDSYNIDLNNQIQQGVIDVIAGMYVDNADNAQPVSFQYESGQRLIIPARFQAYLPVLSNGPPRIRVSSPGGGVARFYLCNMRFMPIMWSTV